jgi:hypothetical protein
VNVDVVDGEAAALIETTDVGGGESGGGFWVVEDEGDAEALTMADDAGGGWGLLGEGADGVVIAEDDEDLGGREPIGGEVAGRFDQGVEGRRESRE